MKQASIAALLLATTALCPSRAAQINVYTDDGTAVTISGQINVDDFEAFKIKAGPLGSKAVVVLSSPGGNVVAAIQIGEFIRLRGWATAVLDECDSACAMIWLGGVNRVMAPTAKIGFHAASVNGQEKGIGNALVGAYLNRIGLGYDAVAFATAASPNDITYLTPSEAKRVGIDVRVIEPKSTQQANTQPTPPPPALVPPLEITPRPVTPQYVKPQQQDGGPPTFIAPIGQVNYLSRHPYQKNGTVEEQVSFLITNLFNIWNSDYIKGMEDMYWNYLNYYGKYTSLTEAMEDKEKFLARWPNRNYKIRQNSMSVQCRPDGFFQTDTVITQCDAKGIVDWEATNTIKRSIGEAAFEYSFRPYPQSVWSPSDNQKLDLRIASEISTVRQRKVTDRGPMEFKLVCKPYRDGPRLPYNSGVQVTTSWSLTDAQLYRPRHGNDTVTLLGTLVNPQRKSIATNVFAYRHEWNCVGERAQACWSVGMPDACLDADFNPNFVPGQNAHAG
jgi:hypothetical protein